MGDLYFDDISDEAAYPSAAILKDLRSLIANGQREGQMIEYKADVSPKENWPETVAAFANSVGGIIVFGVEGKGDQPRSLAGFDPKGVEVKTQLGSTVISRIQPRPAFQIRVLTLDSDATKEIVVLRVSEGEHPPYMHSKDHERRVYLRSGAQRVEADYLQLRALFDKGQRTSAIRATSISALQGNLQVEDPSAGAISSSHFIKFCVSPLGEGARRRLTSDVENLVLTCVGRAFDDFTVRLGPVRSQSMTIFKGSTKGGKLQNFGIDDMGVVGMVKLACVRTDKGLMFFPEELCADLISFLALVGSYYEKIKFYGDCQLTATVLIPEALELRPGSFRGRLPAGHLFEQQIPVFRANFSTEVRVSLHPQFHERIPDYAEPVLNDLARVCGGILSSSFAKFAIACASETSARFV